MPRRGVLLRHPRRPIAPAHPRYDEALLSAMNQKLNALIAEEIGDDTAMFTPPETVSQKWAAWSCSIRGGRVPEHRPMWPRRVRRDARTFGSSTQGCRRAARVASARHERQESVMSERSAWAAGYSMFAAVMLMMVGVFHFMAGLVGIIDDEFYVVTAKWVFEFDVTTWGWIHLIGGVLVVLAGLSVLQGHMYGRIVGTIVAAISALVNFAWLPYQPWWSILMIALSVAVIWALTVHGRDIATPAR
jgi:hypothetical protein